MIKITQFLNVILEGQDLSFEQANQLLDTIFTGEVPEMQIAAFLAAMRVKKAAVSELAGLAASLRQHAVKVETGLDNLVDTCGTGGAAMKIFNISTAAALVAAGAGVYVAKHGNRAITSNCGSADVLMALGVNVAPGPEKVAQCIREAHIGFMFAPKFHPAMKHVQPIRQTLDFHTAFNILGPLANPAGVTAQVMGVSDKSLMRRIAETLQMLGVKRAMVVHSCGLDEISTMGPTEIIHLRNGQFSSETLDPIYYGIPRADYDSLAGGDAETNACIIKGILTGGETGAKKDIVVLNAAAAIMIGGLADDLAHGIELADQAVTNGSAAKCLESLVQISNG
ncbi:MAG: anthranilate phosphoribosyltransferase [Planctomycetes bacterium]|nr:anthranilate phosphoribosyltransferase [Planctomycetota bacterium]